MGPGRPAWTGWGLLSTVPSPPEISFLRRSMVAYLSPPLAPLGATCRGKVAVGSRPDTGLSGNRRGRQELWNRLAGKDSPRERLPPAVGRFRRQRTLRWGKPTAGGRTGRKAGARQGTGCRRVVRKRIPPRNPVQRNGLPEIVRRAPGSRHAYRPPAMAERVKGSQGAFFRTSTSRPLTRRIYERGYPTTGG